MLVSLFSLVLIRKDASGDFSKLGGGARLLILGQNGQLCVIGDVLVVTSYQWSFSDSPVRECHWAYESACFLRALLVHVVDEATLPQ